MTTTLVDASVDPIIDPMTIAIDRVADVLDEDALVETLMAESKARGQSLIGPGGLLSSLTKKVLEAALDAEMTEHLGHPHGGVPQSLNVRNGTRTKTVITEIGPVEIEVPRDRESSFEPHIVKKRQRRLEALQNSGCSCCLM
jgi:transposase-like protein